VSTPKAVALALAAFLFAACNSGHVTGTVKEIEAGPLPGVHITIDGLRTHEQVMTDNAGRFEFQNLPAGAYGLKAEFPDYVMEAQDVALARGATANADFVLHPACLEEGSYVDGGLRWGLQAAQAILYVRFTAVSEPDRWIVDDQCIVGIDHTTTVLSILNMGADSGTIKKTIHIVRDGRVGWNPGDEYIAFVRWEPAI
jgi:hypothetical protein